MMRNFISMEIQSTKQTNRAGKLTFPSGPKYILALCTCFRCSSVPSPGSQVARRLHRCRRALSRRSSSPSRVFCVAWFRPIMVGTMVDSVMSPNTMIAVCSVWCVVCAWSGGGDMCF